MGNAKLYLQTEETTRETNTDHYTREPGRNAAMIHSDDEEEEDENMVL